MEAQRNPVKINDIGLTQEELVATLDTDVVGKKEPISREERLKLSMMKEKQEKQEELEVRTKEQLVKLVDLEVDKKRLDIDMLSHDWARSVEGKEQIKQVAHHYHIYRDLFSSPSQTPMETGIVPEVTVPLFKPLPDRIMHDLFKDWFPGSVRYKDPIPRQIYHFTPHIDMRIDFSVQEKLIKEWEDDYKEEHGTLVTPVCRGNLITPLYAAAVPSVVIDARRTSEGSSFEEDMLPGQVKILKEPSNKNFYSLCLFNLDTTFGDDKPVCHWMVSSVGGETKEMVKFMPVYAIRGLGYHRYVFLLLQHQNPLNMEELSEFSFSKRQLDPLKIIRENNAKPVGLSWFQSSFDDYSQHVMHHQLDIRSPNYEYIEESEDRLKQVRYPFCAPFNHYLDHYRDPKEINRYTLLERLKSVNPFSYEKQFEVDPLPNAYLPQIRDIEPSWLQSTEFKRRNRIGDFRYLRPHSAKIPLNNNVDLDRPFWPPPNNFDLPQKYPRSGKIWKPLRETRWSSPPNEWSPYEVRHEDHMKEFEENDKDTA